MKHSIFSLEFQTAADTVYALAAAPEGPCFAACNSGLYRSLDKGCTWKLLDTSAEKVTTAVAISPQFTADRSVFAAVKGGILRSSDAGETWFTTAFPAPPPLFSSLVVSPDFEHDGVLLAGTLEDGVFSSSNRGIDWQPWNFGLFDLNVLSLAISPHWRADEMVFAAAETGLYRSGNGGRAWRFTGFPTECAPVLCMTILADESADKFKLFAGSETHGLLVSRDEGETWQRLAPDSLPAAVNQLQVSCDSDGSFTMYAMADDGILRSNDEGETWVALQAIEGAPTAVLILDDAVLLGILGQGIMRIPLR